MRKEKGPRFGKLRCLNIFGQKYYLYELELLRALRPLMRGDNFRLLVKGSLRAKEIAARKAGERESYWLNDKG